MINNRLSYKGYFSEIKFDSELLILYGKIENINDLVTFESENSKEIVEEFHNAVDEYLEFCEAINKTPDKIDLKEIDRK